LSRVCVVKFTYYVLISLVTNG